jgi:hypothetical protein
MTNSVLGVRNIQHTNGTQAMSIDGSGRVTRPKTPSWFFQVGDGHGSSTSLVVDPMSWGQRMQDDNGAGGTMSNGSGSNITIPVSGLYWIGYGGIKGSSSSVVGRMNMVKVSGTGDDIFVQARGEETSAYAQMIATQVKYLYAGAVYKITTENNGMWCGGATVSSGFNDPYWTGYLVG